MSGFVPDGYKRLIELRDEMGEGALGSALAGEVRRAYYLDPWGRLKSIGAEFWRGPNAHSAMLDGKVPAKTASGTRIQDAGRPIFVKLLPTKKALPTGQNPAAASVPPLWWPRAGQALALWACTPAALQEAERRTRAAGRAISEGQTDKNLVEMWEEAGGSTTIGSVGRTRRRRRGG